MLSSQHPASRSFLLGRTAPLHPFRLQVGKKAAALHAAHSVRKHSAFPATGVITTSYELITTTTTIQPQPQTRASGYLYWRSTDLTVF